MPDDETLVVSANTEVGTLREEITVSMTGNRIDIDFNPRYFLDALKVIDDDEISVVFNGSMGPCVLKPMDRPGIRLSGAAAAPLIQWSSGRLN